jgi:hypothetical protein
LLLVVVLGPLACSDDGTAGAGESGIASLSDDDGAGDDASDDASVSADADGSGSDDGGGSDDADATATTSAGETAADETAGGDDTGAGAGPIELYRGPVVGGSVPGWNPDDPRPLVLLGRQGTDWIATLARIADADGSLSDNVAEEIVVWGWAAPPPLLYDGPVVGGAIPGWSADDPMPVVMLGRLDLDASWVATLASIAPDGSLGENIADRIVVWGWPAGTVGAPTLRYGGPVDAGAVLRGWDPDAPAPLVLLGRLGETWQSTLARVGADGTLSDNFAEELRVWGW